MDRQPLSSSTRSRPSSSSLFSPASTSLLGKRGAAEAGIDDPQALQKSYRQQQAENDRLKRKVLDHEGRSQRQEDEIRSLKEHIRELEQTRSSLADRSNAGDTLSGRREKEWAEEKAQLQNELSSLRTRSSRTKDENERLQSECSKLHHKVSNMSQSLESTKHLERRVQDLESQNKDLQGWRSRAENLSIALEEEKRKSKYQSEDKKDQAEDREGDRVYRDEFNRQKGHLSSLTTKLHTAEADLKELRSEKARSDQKEKRATEIERELRSDIAILHDQLERARRDMDSVTQSFGSDETPSDSASNLQAKLKTLTQLHNQATTELAGRKSELEALHARHSDLANTSQVTIAEMAKTQRELERELRWAKQNVASAESREKMAKQELETYLYHNEPSSHSMPGGLGSSDQTARIRQLESLVDNYKTELESMSRDSRDLEEKLARGAGLVNASLLEDAETQINSLSNTISTLESSIAELNSANMKLEAEANDLMRRVASGEYNPQKERVVELSANPAAKVLAVRQRVLDDLKAENEALLRRAGSAEGNGAVPRESWERLVKEKEDMERAHAKRLQRLKEIFGHKSKEFLEAVYSLLGWRIKFDESGTDIRLTSMYAPKGKMGLTLKFASQEGHFGTMQMTGGMARGPEMEGMRRFWIEERQSVPGFLAQVTTEMFEKTTMGRGAGYVGLE